MLYKNENEKKNYEETARKLFHAHIVVFRIKNKKRVRFFCENDYYWKTTRFSHIRDDE